MLLGFSHCNFYQKKISIWKQLFLANKKQQYDIFLGYFMYLDTMQSFLGLTPATCDGLSWLLWKLRAFQYIFCFCLRNILLLNGILTYFCWKTCVTHGVPSILCRADLQPATIVVADLPTGSTGARGKKAALVIFWTGGKCGTAGSSEMPVILLDGPCLTQPYTLAVPHLCDSCPASICSSSMTLMAGWRD